MLPRVSSASARYSTATTRKKRPLLRLTVGPHRDPRNLRDRQVPGLVRRVGNAGFGPNGTCPEAGKKPGSEDPRRLGGPFGSAGSDKQNAIPSLGQPCSFPKACGIDPHRHQEGRRRSRGRRNKKTTTTVTVTVVAKLLLLLLPFERPPSSAEFFGQLPAAAFAGAPARPPLKLLRASSEGHEILAGVSAEGVPPPPPDLAPAFTSGRIS